jgi:hypothetical protein
MARPAIHIYPPGTPNPSAITHRCPFCGTGGLSGARPACTPCGHSLPRPLRDALNAAWDEGRGRESGEFAVALDAAVAALGAQEAGQS